MPVFSFGEQNTLDQERFKGLILVKIIKFFYKYTRGELAIVKGRGYFSHHFGILPHRRPITTVGKLNQSCFKNNWTVKPVSL